MGTCRRRRPGMEQDAAPLVSLKNVHKTYLLGVEGVPALRGVSLDVHAGEMVTILGTSGGGKTTLLNIIGTIDKPTRGDVVLCDTQINHNTPDGDLSAIRLHHLGFVCQTFNLISSMTSVENVELPMVLAGVLSPSQRRERALMLLNKVGLGHRPGHFPGMLSGGEQQRVTIARSLANNPKILLLDEPTGDLDTQNTHIVMKILTDLRNEEGVTLVMVTHDVELSLFSDRIVRVSDGKINVIDTVPSDVRQAKLEELALKNEEIVRKAEEAQAQGLVAPTKVDVVDPEADINFAQTHIRKPE